MLREGAPERTLREELPRILLGLVLFLVIVWFVSRGLPGMWDDVRGILVGR